MRVEALLISATAMFLHFYEEFAFPGGFTWMGMKVEMRKSDTDARKWPLNEINSLFGNWWFALLVYVVPLFLPNVIFLMLGIAVTALLEVLMHLFIFNISMKLGAMGDDYAFTEEEVWRAKRFIDKIQ